MPSLRDTIQPFVDRLSRDPGATFQDEAFARAFNALGLPLRRAIMDRVEGVRRQRLATERLARGYGATEERIRQADHTLNLNSEAPAHVTVAAEENRQEQILGSSNSDVNVLRIGDLPRTELTIENCRFYTEGEETPILRRNTSDNDINVDTFHSNEENARLERIAQMRRDMVREIEEFRFRATEAYQRRMPQDRTTEQFQRWSQWVEANARDIRSRWERRIASEMPTPPPRPSPPVVLWPDPVAYGPNDGYRSVRGALSAFTRAVNVAYATRVAGGAWEEARDRIHINGTRDIREAWRGWQCIPDPPPTTTAWVDEPEVDELDIMIKHLPRSGRCVVITPTSLSSSILRTRLNDAGIPERPSFIFSMKTMSNRNVFWAVRNLRIPVFIDPAVFKMHAKREGDWTDEELDAIIELQGEIPDEETVT